MNQETQEKHEQEDRSKELHIVVNGKQKNWSDKEITFQQVVELAFGNQSNPNTIYTVTYKRAEGHKPQGTLVAGESVRVKEGTIFNVTATDKS